MQDSGRNRDFKEVNNMFADVVTYLRSKNKEEVYCIDDLVDIFVEQLFDELDILDILYRYPDIQSQAHAVLRDNLIEFDTLAAQGRICVC